VCIYQRGNGDALALAGQRVVRAGYLNLYPESWKNAEHELRGTIDQATHYPAHLSPAQIERRGYRHAISRAYPAQCLLSHRVSV